MVPKAAAGDFPGRFREIISDPLNILIHRHPQAGLVHEGLVVLHNGHRVPLRGPAAYYGNFSDILILNRGVHEPLEEWVFQEVLKTLPPSPVMLELGAYWGHYSMWLKQMHADAVTHLVEPDQVNLACGIGNFQRHGYHGFFHQKLVGLNGFHVDSWMSEFRINSITILHSDIQGFELEMLAGAADALRRHAIRHIFLSTHSQALHVDALRTLEDHGYRVEISADFDSETTSHDGFLFASAPSCPRLFDTNPHGRVELVGLPTNEVLSRLAVLESRVSY